MAGDRSAGVDGEILGRLGELRECQDLFESAKQMLKTKQELHDVSKDLCAGCPNMLWKEGGKWKAVNPAAAEIKRLKEEVAALCHKAFTGGVTEAEEKGWLMMMTESEDYRRRLHRLANPPRRRGQAASQQDQSQLVQENPEPQQSSDPPVSREPPHCEDPPPWDLPGESKTTQQAETSPSTAPLEGARTESGPDAGHADGQDEPGGDSGGNWWECQRWQWQREEWNWNGENRDKWRKAAWSEDAWQSHAGEESKSSWDRQHEGRNDSGTWHGNAWHDWQSHEGQQNDSQQNERGSSSGDRGDSAWRAGAWQQRPWQ
ncbi:unc45b [Symbiodinium sp. CCMP2592]|nr:unc45b [Symbiodinium sp. CCMP2592]